jgi:hypothetical protein
MVVKHDRIWKMAASVNCRVMSTCLREKKKKKIVTSLCKPAECLTGHFLTQISECFCYTICSAWLRKQTLGNYLLSGRGVSNSRVTAEF